MAKNDKLAIPFVIAFMGAFVVGIMRFIEFLVRGGQKKLWWIVIILALAVGFGTFLIPGTTNDDVMTVTLMNFVLYNIIYWFGGTLINILQFLSIFSGGSSGGSGGGGFGGFGGGRSGGGGASGKW